MAVTTGGSAFPFAHNVLLAARDVGLGGHVTGPTYARGGGS
jgi:hypothetical protein